VTHHQYKYITYVISLKHVYRWISESCPNAKLVIKTDDDISLNLRKFPNFLKNFTTQLGENFHSDAFFIGGKKIWLSYKHNCD